MKFRCLKANEIDVRVATVKENGCSLLLYKDARVDQNILDETVGAENWQNDYQNINGVLFCSVSIWDENKNQWITKKNAGTKSFAEAEKGEASDSFKRACFNWGIGRELYTAPFIWVNSKNCEISNKNGKPTTFDKFTVNDIKINEETKVIEEVTIYNESKKCIAFTTNKNAYKKQEEKKQPTATNIYKCECCGKEFKPLRDKKGKIYSSKEIFDGWKEKGVQRGDNKALCADCIKNLNKQDGIKEVTKTINKKEEEK